MSKPPAGIPPGVFFIVAPGKAHTIDF